MSGRTSDASSIVNASGYPFQEAIEHEVNRTRDAAMHGWQVLFSEYPWSDERTHEAGFIDLGLEQGDVRIIIECKRVKQAKWIFLVSNRTPGIIERARLALHRPSWAYIATDEFRLTPGSIEARFCSIRGSGEEEPWLERVAGKLVRSVDAVALEEYKRHGAADYQRYYLPMIVTNAGLNLCKYELEKVSLETGTVTDETFETAEYLRFRKAFDSRLEVAGRDLASVSKRRERTVFVVNASRLGRFLQLLNVHDFNQIAGVTAAFTPPSAT